MRIKCYKCGELISELKMVLRLHSCSVNDNDNGGDVLIKV